MKLGKDRNDTIVANFSSFSPATVLMFAMSSIGIALALIPLLLPGEDLRDFIEYIGQFQITVSVRIVCMKRKSGRIWFLIMPYQSL